MFFRSRQCTRVYRLGVQKHPKLEKKGCVFLVMATNFGKDMTHNYQKKKKKKKKKNMYLGSIFIPWKYMLRVCFESPFMRMISSLKYKCLPQKFSFFICCWVMYCFLLQNWSWMDECTDNYYWVLNLEQNLSLFFVLFLFVLFYFWFSVCFLLVCFCFAVNFLLCIEYGLKWI